MSERQTVLLCSHHERNRHLVSELQQKLDFIVLLVQSEPELSRAVSAKMDIAWIFFVHWSLHVPESIYSSLKCVGFHMSDLPFGRGGSPLQNLILGGHKQTMISAFRVESELDAGPVYLKSPVSLKGSAEEILQRVSREIFNMIQRIISENLEPTAQQGEVHLFRRRKPSESEITEISSIRALYDFVRMLDAEGYPRAFLRVGDSKIVLSNARLSSDEEILEVTLKFHESD